MQCQAGSLRGQRDYLTTGRYWFVSVGDDGGGNGAIDGHVQQLAQPDETKSAVLVALIVDKSCLIASPALVPAPAVAVCYR